MILSIILALASHHLFTTFEQVKIKAISLHEENPENPEHSSLKNLG